MWPDLRSSPQKMRKEKRTKCSNLDSRRHFYLVSIFPDFIINLLSFFLCEMISFLCSFLYLGLCPKKISNLSSHKWLIHVFTLKVWFFWNSCGFYAHWRHKVRSFINCVNIIKKWTIFFNFTYFIDETMRWHFLRLNLCKNLSKYCEISQLKLNCLLQFLELLTINIRSCQVYVQTTK